MGSDRSDGLRIRDEVAAELNSNTHKGSAVMADCSAAFPHVQCAPGGGVVPCTEG